LFKMAATWQTLFSLVLYHELECIDLNFLLVGVVIQRDVMCLLYLPLMLMKMIVIKRLWNENWQKKIHII
jgi:hypothetical protein